jgi:hypothetical protein
MKEKSIYKNVLKLNEKIENLKKPKTQETSKFKCSEVSVSNPGDGASDVVL